MMWLLGTSTISYYQEMAAEEHPTVLGPYDRAERLYDKKTLPHPTPSPITALRTCFGIAILACSWSLPVTSLAFAAELFEQGAVLRVKVDEQLTATTGILGAIAGYLFGKATNGPDGGQKPNTTGTT